jgi:2,3-bisphosphoglycerate-dependent phosphoglycerate mutase
VPRLLAAIARHGEYHQPPGVPSAHLPYPLTEQGRDQARSLAEQLLALAAEHGAELHPVLDASSLLRAHETAVIAASTLGQQLGRAFSVEDFPELAERCLGPMANLTVDEIEAAVARDPRFEAPPDGWKASSDYRLPYAGAESLMQAGERVAAHLRARMDHVASGATRDTLKVFVAHGGALRHAAVVLGLLQRDRVPALSMHHCRPLLFELDADGEFRHLAGQWKQRAKKAPLD